MGCVVHGTAFAVAVVQAYEWVIQSYVMRKQTCSALENNLLHGAEFLIS